MTNKEAIERWAEYIIPTVFRAEQQLLITKPEWEKRLKYVLVDDAPKIAYEYCRAIAEIIVTNAEDYDPNEKEE